MKTLENYFTEDVALPEGEAGPKGLTEPERAFMEKYMGASWQDSPVGKALERPVNAEVVLGGGASPPRAAVDASFGKDMSAQAAPGKSTPGQTSQDRAALSQSAPGQSASGRAAQAGNPPGQVEGGESFVHQDAAAGTGHSFAPSPPAMAAQAAEPDFLAQGQALEEGLMAEEELRLVSFFIGDQIFAVPIMLVQEVLRAVPAIKLPAAPPHLSGVTNLRGRVTPLVDLACLLGVARPEGQTDAFLIVCRMGQMQMGLTVRAIDTMYKAPRADIEWNIEAQVGVSAGLMAGLLKSGDKLIQILSVSRLFQKVLKS